MSMHVCFSSAGCYRSSPTNFRMYQDPSSTLLSLSGKITRGRPRSSYKWRTLVELLGLPFSKLQSLAADHRDKFEECCQAVLGQWLDNPPPDYPTTWQGLIELLEDSQLGQVMTELRNVWIKQSYGNSENLIVCNFFIVLCY